MKSVEEVLRLKEEEVQRVRKEVEALRIAAGLLNDADDSADHKSDSANCFKCRSLVPRRPSREKSPKRARTRVRHSHARPTPVAQLAAKPQSIASP